MTDPTANPDRAAVGSTSRSLINALRRDDVAAWERLVRLYAPLVVLWCRQGKVAEQDIADVYQDVLRTVSQTIENFRHDRSTDTFRGWLRQITRSRVADHFRRRQRQPQAAGGTEAQMWLQELPEGNAEAAASEEIFGEVLSRALNEIRTEFQPRTWQAFWAVTVQGRSPADVGGELDMLPGTVRVVKSRVLQRLREELGDLPR